MKCKTLTLLSVVFGLAACDTMPPESYYNRGQPENLLDVSSEVVNLPVSSQPSIQELTRWIEKDQPSRAELYCEPASDNCQQAQDVLDLYGVPTLVMPSGDELVSLVYERVLARDCENRYIDNSINPYNLNHPTFGCSTSVNMVQMVTDKHQFVRPNLRDPMDARKAVQAYHNYLQPREIDANPAGIQDSLLEESQVE